MKPTRVFWSDESDAILRLHYREHGAQWCAEQLGRTRLSVYQRAAKLRLTGRPKFASDDELLALIRELHPQGYSDSEIRRVASERYECQVDRHRVGVLRRGLSLQANSFSERTRQRVAEKTRDQLQAAGLNSLAELRTTPWPAEVRVDGRH